MEAVKSFVFWFLEQLPAFLMSEPICYFVGFAFLLVTLRVFIQITKLR